MQFVVRLRPLPWLPFLCSRTILHDDARVHDQVSLVDDIGRRLCALPGLVRAAPASGSCCKSRKVFQQSELIVDRANVFERPGSSRTRAGIRPHALTPCASSPLPASLASLATSRAGGSCCDPRWDAGVVAASRRRMEDAPGPVVSAQACHADAIDTHRPHGGPNALTAQTASSTRAAERNQTRAGTSRCRVRRVDGAAAARQADRRTAADHPPSGGFPPNYVAGGTWLTPAQAYGRHNVRLPGGMSPPGAPRFRMVDPRSQGLAVKAIRLLGSLAGAVDPICVDLDVWEGITIEERIVHHVSPRDIERAAAHGCTDPRPSVIPLPALLPTPP